MKGRGRVVAASMGNHAQAVAFAARSLGMDALIVMPKTVSIVKEEATRGYGADVVLWGDGFQQALDHALSLTDRAFIHAYDDDAVIAGQGTLALELLADLRPDDIVLIPVGGGGLVAGCAAALKESLPGVQVIGVQAQAAPSAFLSLREGSRVTRTPSHTLADGIAVGTVGERTFSLIRRYVDDIVTVREETIAMAILLFMERSKFVVEGAGATPLAALLELPGRFNGRRVVLVASGGNIDPTLIDRMIYKGLLTSGRIAVFEVTADDVPGSLQTLAGIVAGHGGNILDVAHDRLQADLPVGKTRVTFTVETRRASHLDEIIGEMKARGFEAARRQ
jgi:threonine dehydratase